MPKRPAPTSPPASATKKVKAVPAAKASPATKASPAAKGGKKAAAAAKTKEVKDKSTIATVAESVTKSAKKAAAEISDAVDKAGDLLIDDVAPAPEKKTRAKKGAAAAAPAPALAATRGTKRKTTETLKDKAENVVASVADKVGEALSGVVREFGEASGLIEKTTEKKAKAAPAKKTAAPAKKGKKAAEPEPESEDEEKGDEEEGSDASFIGAFESDEEMGGADSSDDESDAEDAAIAEAGRKIDMSKLPPAKDDKSVAARLKKASKKKGLPVGTIFLGRIPHGFYEEQMKEYFSQFGDVTRLRLARNPKTGASRHYAYIEFSSAAVAEIVADTMNNYLLMGHLLRCNVIPQDQVHPELWVGANKKWRMVPRARLEKVRQDKTRTKEQKDRANANLLKRQEERRQKIKAAGIDYEFDGHQ